MKKLIFTFFVVFISTASFAQIQKGDVQLGGNVQFNKAENSGFESTYFSVNPKVGFLLSDVTSLGFTVGYQSREVNSVNSNLFLVGAYSRFHKMISEQFYLYLEPSVTFGFGKEDDSSTDINTFSIGISPGMTYFLSPKFAMEVNIGNLSYRSEKQKSGNSEFTDKTYGLSLNSSSLLLGFSYYFK